MKQLLKQLIAMNENRDPDTNEIIWNFVEADAYRLVRKHYESDDEYFRAFDAAADAVDPQLVN